MSTELSTREPTVLPAAVEALLATGDLSKLNTEQRIEFYKARCQAAGLDPRARPFEYIMLQGKLMLYAKKECAEQLNGIHGLSHEIISRENVSGLYEVCVQVTSRSGRTSQDIGTVVIEGLKGAELANARMKAVTKAKRRATLSFCGMGDVIDETELDTVEHRPAGSHGQRLPFANNSGHATGMYASKEQTTAFLKAMEGYCDRRNAQWLDRWLVPNVGEYPRAIAKDLIRYQQADNHLVKWAVATGRLDPTIRGDETKSAQYGRFTAIIYHRSTEDRRALTQELRRYCDEQERLQTEKLYRTNPELFEREPGGDDEIDEDEAFDRITAGTEEHQIPAEGGVQNIE
jgi:hypothetical protein